MPAVPGTTASVGGTGSAVPAGAAGAATGGGPSRPASARLTRTLSRAGRPSQVRSARTSAAVASAPGSSINPGTIHVIGARPGFGAGALRRSRPPERISVSRARVIAT